MKEQRIVVSGVAFRRGRVLLLKRADTEDVYPGWWELPSGKVRWGENPAKALQREFLEETQLKVKPAEVIDVNSYFVQKKGKKERRHTVQIVYLAKIQSGQLKLSPAHTEARWVAEKELRSFKEKLFDTVRAACLQAFRHARHI